MTPKHFAPALILATVALASPVLAEEDWDTDGDGGYSSDEYNAGASASGQFTEWDTDGDGMLSEDEYNAGNFSRYDANADGMIDADEREDVDRDFGGGDDDDDETED